MGNCGSQYTNHYCYEAAHQHGPINADPNIVGPGVRILRLAMDQILMIVQVLAAFGITGFITFGAIILAYLTDSLPQSYLRGVDLVVIESVQRSLLARLLGSICRYTSAWSRIVIRTVKKCLFISTSDSQPLSSSREQRIEALTRFVLTLSDQQIVTGLAILIGAVWNICQLTSYEFAVVVSLAWFSSATHIATLDVLQEYFRRQRVLYLWRVAAMVILLGFLTFGLIVGIWSNLVPGITPLGCINWTLKPGIDSKSFGPWIPYDFNGYAFYILPNVVAIFYLLIAYANRIINLHQTSTTDTEHHSFLWQRFWSSYLWLRLPLRRISSFDRAELARIALTRYEDDVRETTMLRLEGKNGFQKTCACYKAYSASFLSRISSLFFALSYGASNVVSWRWYQSPTVASADSRIDFGQIVAILLLAIPVLAALETFYHMNIALLALTLLRLS
jgi:hypothetical protein